MKNAGKIAIPICIVAVIVAIVIMIPNEKSDSMEVEDILDKEVMPDEDISPEVQKKLDEIEKINLENEYSPKPREWITSGLFRSIAVNT